MSGRVLNVCTAKRKGEQKRAVESAAFVVNQGIEGDGHAGAKLRQVSMLDAADVVSVREVITELQPGDFGENLVIEGINLESLGLGSRLRLGERVELRISQIGKACHTPCHIHRRLGDCIMPRKGLFGVVLSAGSVKTGDSVELIERVGREVTQFAVITVSDRRSRGEEEDTAGPAVTEALEEALGAHRAGYEIVPDEVDSIHTALTQYSDECPLDIVLTVGGTGFSPRDVTPEATRALLERPAPGLDEAMRVASLSKTPHAMLSRGNSGIRRRTLIINLPGSRRGAVENLRAVAPALRHAVEKLRGSDADCGRERGEGGR